MRLVFVTHTLPPLDRPHDNIGGMQRGAMELLRTLQVSPRVELTPVVLHTSTRWEEVTTVAFIAKLLATLPTTVRRSGAEAVFFSSPVTALLAPVLKRRLGVPVGAIVHGLDMTLPVAPYQRWMKRTIPHLDALFPISRATAAECLSRGAPPERVHVIPFGLDADRFAGALDRDAARASLRERLGLPAGSFVLFSLGRQVKRKGTAWFVEHVMPKLPEDVVYVVAGDGPELADVRAKAGPLSGRLHLLGRVDEVQMTEGLLGSDLFVMPNVPVAGDMEGQGLVLLEAGVCGLPSIAADMEGIADVVVNGRNGTLVQPLDADAFVSAIMGMYTDRDQLSVISKSARDYTTEKFSWNNLCDRYIDVFEQLVAAKSSPRGA